MARVSSLASAVRLREHDGHWSLGGVQLELTSLLGGLGGIAVAIAGDGDVEQQLCPLHHSPHQATGLGVGSN